MKKFNSIILVFFTLIVSLSCKKNTTQVTPVIPADPCVVNGVRICNDQLYDLGWSDEFNTDGAPNDANWGYETGFVRNNEAQWYQKENAVCLNGNLVITGKKEQKLNPNYVKGSTDWTKSRQYAEYTSASLKMKNIHAFQYGRMEVRAKINAQTGLWPAIWTLGVSGEWPSNGEVDVMEYYGGGLHANFAFGSATRWEAIWDGYFKNLSTFNDIAWDTKFHVWVLDWDENSMKIYVDNLLLNSIDLNKTFNKIDGKNPFRQKHYALLNLALGGNSGGSLTNTTFPSEYLVDYIRLYKKK